MALILGILGLKTPWFPLPLLLDTPIPFRTYPHSNPSSLHAYKNTKYSLVLLISVEHKRRRHHAIHFLLLRTNTHMQLLSFLFSAIHKHKCDHPFCFEPAVNEKQKSWSLVVGHFSVLKFFLD